MSLPPLNELGSPRLLVIGDLILDEYLWGDVSRISPEAPVPVLRVRHREHRSGGAGSVVENLVVLGAEVAVCGPRTLMPPVPEEQTKPSTLPSVCCQISSPVVARWIAQLAVLSNWRAQMAP